MAPQPPTAADLPAGRLRAAPRADWLALALLAGVLLFISWNTLGPVIDEDLWYHLAVGRWIVEHRALPTRDVFSQPGDRPWTSYGPLWDASIYLLYRFGGLQGIELYRWATSAVAAMLTWALLQGRLRSPATAAAAAWVAVAAALPVFQERSWMASVIGLLATLLAVDRVRQGDRRPLFWLPVLFVAWANWHIQVMYGLLALALAAGEDLATRWLRAPLGLAPSSRAPLSRTAGLFAASCAATLVHPLGWRLFPLALSFRAPVHLQRWIEELHPPDFTEVSDWLVGALGALVAMAILRRLRQPAPRRLPLMELALALLGLQRFIHYRRDGWFLALLCAAALATLVGADGAARLEPAWESVRGSRFTRWAAAAALGVAAVRVLALAIAFPESALEAAVQRHFPVAAVAEVERLQLPGPLFNDFNWGGYLMFALGRLPVATDSRMDAHSEDQLELNILTWLSKAHDPALDRAQLIISQRFHGLPDELLTDPRFVRVYADDHAQVFIRWGVPPGSPPVLPVER